MQIIKGTEPIPVEHPVILLIGDPGIGKTSLGYSCNEPLLLDFDGGAHRAVNRRDTLVIRDWKDAAELAEQRDSLEHYGTLVVDTVGRCLDLMTTDIIASNPKLGPGGNLSQQGWGALKTRFRTWLTQLRSYGLDVLLLAHAKEERDNDVRIIRGDITGGSYGEVMKVCDFIGYLTMVGKDRILDFSPSDRWVGKNPAQWPPFKVPPAAKAQTFMAGLFDKGREALGTISSISAHALSAVEDFKLALQGATDARAFNTLLADMKKAPTIVQAQVRAPLWEAAKARGVTFDKDHFVDPISEPQSVA